jgi:membrane-bound metal-dependent hydrolase YbcI (DUF457 family)
VWRATERVAALIVSDRQLVDMFVGHALLAFALVATGASRLGYESRRALTVGVLAGAFAAAPDVDMAYALVGIASASGSGPLGLASSFWSTSTLVHRAVTHSLVVSVPLSVAAAAWVRGGVGRPAAVGLCVGLVAVAGVVSGALGGAVTALFAVACLAVAALAGREGVSPRATLAVALVGFWSHPFGDVFTGEPPAFLYPFDVTLLTHRVALSADPTLHLLGAFVVELAAIWLGVLVALRLAGVRATVAPRATLGAGYAASILVVPAPTLDLSYPFVFSVLAVGAVALLPMVRTERVDAGRGGLRVGRFGTAKLPAPGGLSVDVRRPTATTATLTALSTVTVAWAAYTLAYVLV